MGLGWRYRVSEFVLHPYHHTIYSPHSHLLEPTKMKWIYVLSLTLQYPPSAMNMHQYPPTLALGLEHAIWNRAARVT
jgi:hypothetical protein